MEQSQSCRQTGHGRNGEGLRADFHKAWSLLEAVHISHSKDKVRQGHLNGSAPNWGWSKKDTKKQKKFVDDGIKKCF